jgi:hypothetical protein
MKHTASIGWVSYMEQSPPLEGSGQSARKYARIYARTHTHTHAHTHTHTHTHTYTYTHIHIHTFNYPRAASKSSTLGSIYGSTRRLRPVRFGLPFPCTSLRALPSLISLRPCISIFFVCLPCQSPSSLVSTLSSGVQLIGLCLTPVAHASVDFESQQGHAQSRDNSIKSRASTESSRK